MIMAHLSIPALPTLPRTGFDQEALAPMAEAFAALYGDRAMMVKQIAADAMLGANTSTTSNPKLFALYGAAVQALRGNELNAPRLGNWFKSVEGQVVDGRAFMRSGGGKARRKIALHPIRPSKEPDVSVVHLACRGSHRNLFAP
jgi:hypothetical protein